MKYLTRAVKYFFYFAFLTTAIILALILIGAVEGNIDTIFEGGYNALWKIAIFFALVAAIYPKFGFVRRRLEVDADWDQVRNAAKTYFSARPFKLESESADTLTFRRRDMISRMTKMGEDRVTLSRSEEGYMLEGLRKDILIFATGLEYSLTPREDGQA